MASRGSEVSVQRAIEQIGENFSAELFFCGGHGGFVECAGENGPMVKRGGPMDRVFALRNVGELGGNNGLDIHYGAIDFETGSLIEIDTRETEELDELAVFEFEGNEAEDAVVLRGSIRELGLPLNTVLFRGSVDSSRMLWQRSTASEAVQLPYTAVHSDFQVHPALREHFDLPEPVVAVSAWCKVEVPQASIAGGGSFVSQQHLGSLRVFFP
jgi:hypothetical protein